MAQNTILLKVRSGEEQEQLFDCESIVVDRDTGKVTLTAYDRKNARYEDVVLLPGSEDPAGEAGDVAPSKEKEKGDDDFSALSKGKGGK